jgi:signal transduction histidine kinase
MGRYTWPERLTPRSRWTGFLISLLAFVFVAYRKLTLYAGQPSFAPAALLLGALFLLFLAQLLFSHRFRWNPYPGIFLQVVLIQALGLLRPYDDPWAILYVALGFQVMYACPLRKALFLGGLFAILIMLTMALTFGWISGLGRSVFMVAAMLLVLSYDALYALAEAGHQESQELLRELQGAHQKLEAYAAQAEELVTEQERSRLMHALHDSVGQMIFSINLTAESARLVLEKDSEHLPAQLEQLQELTGSALSQMRTLIGQWRPG